MQARREDGRLIIAFDGFQAQTAEDVLHISVLRAPVGIGNGNQTVGVGDAYRAGDIGV